jgi:glycosyltransferase involved in cell wall biosynthesis
MLLCESYGAGVGTYIDTIISNKELFSDSEFFVLVSSERREKSTEIDKEFIVNDNLSFGKSPIKFIFALMTINKIVKHNSIDILHANSSMAGFLMYIYSFINHRIHFIYTPHGYYSLRPMNQFKKWLVQLVEKRINCISDYVIHVSNSEEKEAINHRIVKPKKSIVIFNGVEDPCANRKKRKNILTIVNVARVETQKNPFLFVRIAKEIVQQNKRIRFIWAGEGKHLKQIKDDLEECQLQNRIQFIGFTENVAEVLKHGDLFFSTSYYEGLPFSVIEAMSNKLPLVLSDIVGHKDLVKNDVNGILFSLKDEARIIRLILDLAENEAKLEKYSFSSYRYYKNNFSVNVMLKKLDYIYQDCKSN